MKRVSLVASTDNPLAALAAGASSGASESAAQSSSASDPSLGPTSPTRANSVAVPLADGPLRPAGPDEIVVDSVRARLIASRTERSEQVPPPVPARPTSMVVEFPIEPVSRARANSGSTPLPPNIAAAQAAQAAQAAAQAASPAAASSASSPTPSSPASTSSSSNQQLLGPVPFKASSLPCRSRDWHPSEALSRDCSDDWDSHGRVSGEKAVMQIPDVTCYNAHDDLSSVCHSLHGTLFMTSYQLFLEPTQRRDRLGQAVQAMPLSTIDRIEIEKSRSGSANAYSALASLSFLDIYSKDGRYIKFGFPKFDECKRAYDCLNLYVFPAKDEYLFAFYYKLRAPIPAHLDGWNLYDPIEEFKRQGINTLPLAPPQSLYSEGLRLSWANESYSLCASYPRVFVVPSEKYITDLDLHVVGRFRSRGRIPVCTWKHPLARQTIWRCSQPKVGMNNARCAEDERLLSSITNYAQHGEMFAIYDARPKFNARANILAGKGFENPELYKNCVKKINFMSVENIHVMRDSHAKLVRACQKETHDLTFLTNVAHSGWLSHIACCLKATAEMVKAIDQDKISLLIHCSDGWDRTAQLSSLCQLCLDPFYRTTKGFFILVEKEWVSFGHQFQRRTGHREKNYADDQRSCIFLQWCDSVFQLLQQFPRHFEFNSHLLVTLVHHLYSCRFGTFFYNTDVARRKNKLREKTVSIWTYFMCSPAAVAGEFTNHLYARSGNGTDAVSTNAPSTSADEEIGRSSVGRGGGDGSRFDAGTVLYPSYSLKRIVLWSDYFLRWNNEQCEQVPIGAAAGSVPPFGAVTTKLYGNDAAMQKEVRRVQKENQTLSASLHHQTSRVRDLERELKALKARYDPDAGSAEDSRARAPSDADLGGAEDGNEETRTPPRTSDAESAALESLRQRLEQDVDLSVIEDEPEKPEDPTTL